MTPRLPGLRDQEGTAQMSAKNVKTKPAGILTKLVVLVLLVATATALLNLQSQILAARVDKAALEAERDMQRQINADLKDAVENSGDPDRQADLARSKLGLVAPGDQVIYFTE